MARAKSPWRSEVYVPPDESGLWPQMVYYGCRAWEPRYDQSMGHQDRQTGRWFPGDQRQDPSACGTCGQQIEPGGYCEGCFSAAPKVDERLDRAYQAMMARVIEEERRKEEAEKKTFAERMHGGHSGDAA